MKYNYLVSTYNETMTKYKKYFSKLQRAISNGSLDRQSAHRKNFLVRKVEALRLKLSSMQPRLTSIAATAGLVLALGMGTANAQFNPGPAKNPFGETQLIQNSNNYSMIAVADLDGDSDNDVIVVSYSNLLYYKNTGTNNHPAFTLQSGTGANNPLGLLTTDFGYSSPSLADIDGDGDLDMIMGGEIQATNSQLSYFENTGNATSPAFTKIPGTSSPMPVISNYIGFGRPSFVDIDNDGDKDLFEADGNSGKVYYFQNTGTSSSPIFTANTSNNPFPTGDITGVFGADIYLFLNFADIDSDGDQDALAGLRYGEIIQYKNTGTKSAPVLSLQTGSVRPFSIFNNRWQDPSFVDMNNDGLKDLVLGLEGDVSIHFNQGSASIPKFIEPINFGNYTRPTFADIDGDGDKDLVTTNGSGTNQTYYKNIGPKSKPVFIEVTGTSNPLANITQIIANTFGDVDGDGDLDLVTGDGSGNFHYYKNTGNKTNPVYTSQTGTNNPFNLINITFSSSPALVDIDNDGDLDLVSGAGNGGIIYIKNSGSRTNPSYAVAPTGASNPFSYTSSGSYNMPTFNDIDKDGVLDMIIGTGVSGIKFYKNDGTATAAVFNDQTGTNNVFAFVQSSQPGDYLGTAFIDIDNDGDIDMLVGDDTGYLKLYENNGQPLGTEIFSPISTAFNGALHVYPNPTKDLLNVKLDDAIGANVTVIVMDITGMELSSQEFNNNGSAITVNVGGLETGVYLIKLSADAKSGVLRFIKQ